MVCHRAPKCDVAAVYLDDPPKVTDVASMYGIDGKALRALRRHSFEKQGECLGKLQEGVKSGNVRNASAYLTKIMQEPDSFDLDLKARKQLEQLPAHVQAELLQKLAATHKVRNPSAWIIKSVASAKKTIDAEGTQAPPAYQTNMPQQNLGPMLLGRCGGMDSCATVMSLLDKKARALFQQLRHEEQVELANQLVLLMGANGTKHGISNPSAWITKSAKLKIASSKQPAEMESFRVPGEQPYMCAPFPPQMLMKSQLDVRSYLAPVSEIMVGDCEPIEPCKRKPSKKVTFGWTEFCGSSCLDGLKGDIGSDDEDTMSTVSTRVPSKAPSRASSPDASHRFPLMSRMSSDGEDSDDDAVIASELHLEDLPPSLIEEDSVDGRRAASPVEPRRAPKKRVTWGVVDKRVYQVSSDEDVAFAITPFVARRRSSPPPRTRSPERRRTPRTLRALLHAPSAPLPSWLSTPISDRFERQR